MQNNQHKGKIILKLTKKIVDLCDFSPIDTMADLSMSVIKNIYRYIRILLIRVFALIMAKKELKLPGRVLLLSPHPDDETFGCGGLILRLIKQGSQVYVVFMTDGEGAYPASVILPEELKNRRLTLARSAAAILGIPAENVYTMGWNDGKINETMNDATEMEVLMEQLKPDAVLSPHPFEGWADHVATSQLADRLVASCGFPVSNYKYCVWLWYSMPYDRIGKLDWKNASLLTMNSEEHRRKLHAIDAYVQVDPAFGHSFSGDLPPLFVKANRWKKELFFKKQ